jgi:hypothetical protein
MHLTSLPERNGTFTFFLPVIYSFRPRPTSATTRNFRCASKVKAGNQKTQAQTPAGHSEDIPDPRGKPMKSKNDDRAKMRLRRGALR